MTLSQLLSIMISCIRVVPWARLHVRKLQWFLHTLQQRKASNSSRQVKLPQLQSLRWWTSPAVMRGCLFKEPERLDITSDAILYGWGPHFRSQVTQGRWSWEEAAHNINWLELRAARLARRHFCKDIVGQNVLLLTDNIATKTHINRQGSTHSRGLMSEAEMLERWAELHMASLRVDHISEVDNVRVDWLSWQTIDNSEWHVHPDLFCQITQWFGMPQLDFFASPANAQLPRFYLQYHTPQAEGIEALQTKWPQGLLYGFPPLPLILQVIMKIFMEEMEVFLVAPHWPRRTWYADLVSLSIQKS